MVQQHGTTITDAFARVKFLLRKNGWTTDEESECVTTMKILSSKNCTTWQSRTEKKSRTGMVRGKSTKRREITIIIRGSKKMMNMEKYEWTI